MAAFNLSHLFIAALLIYSTHAFAEGTNDPVQIRNEQALSKSRIIEGAIGPFRTYCAGYGNPGASGFGYVTVVTLHAGLITQAESRHLEIQGQNEQGLGGTVAFDRAEAGNAYIGQINLITASSFSGLNGVIWGYDVAKADEPLKEKISETLGIDVYPIDPILDAGQRLFGNNKEQRFPILPGSMIIAAHKDKVGRGPKTIWCGIGLAIADDRTHHSDLFMELCGEYEREKSQDSIEERLQHVRENIAKGVIKVGENQGVKYKKVYVGTIRQDLARGEVGYVMATAPYVLLAKNAVPDSAPTKLLEMSIAQWEESVRDKFYHQVMNVAP